MSQTPYERRISYFRQYYWTHRAEYKARQAARRKRLALAASQPKGTQLSQESGQKSENENKP
jgi:hypothetical protein